LTPPSYAHRLVSCVSEGGPLECLLFKRPPLCAERPRFPSSAMYGNARGGDVASTRVQLHFGKNEALDRSVNGNPTDAEVAGNDTYANE